MNSVVTFESVSKKYGTRKVLDGMTLHIPERKITALIGRNGSGKTTSLKIICNILKYDSGRVKVFGETITPKSSSYKNQIGVVLNRDVLIDSFSTVEYLEFVGQFQNIAKTRIRSRIDELASFLHIQDPTISIKKLSMGNQMKVCLAAALLHNPEFLILDEPFSNFDSFTTDHVVKLLKGLSKTILITSHNIELISGLGNNFIMIDDGKKTGEFSSESFKEKGDVQAEINRLLGSDSASEKINWLS